MHRALIVESTRDTVAKNRRNAVLQSEELSNWQITYVYVVEPEDIDWQHEVSPGSILQGAASFGDSIPLDSIDDRLYYRLKAQITAFRPAFLFLIPGFVFRQYKQQIYGVLEHLRDEHQTIKIGHLRHRANAIQDAPAGLFDQDPEFLTIQRMFSDEIIGTT